MTWNFNPRSPCGERRVWTTAHARYELISIHAPRAGSDRVDDRVDDLALDFNPRSPCGERSWCPGGASRWAYFNPRSPCGERCPFHLAPDIACYFNPRSPCGERLQYLLALDRSLLISIHAPRAGSDRDRGDPGQHARDFNPRSPCGERSL